MNQIPHLQQTSRQLERLAAQRTMYSDAKIILGVQMFLAVPCAILSSTLAALYPDLKVYTLAWSVVISLLDATILSTLSNVRRRDAAKIQELFDCEALRLPWNDLKAEHRPDPEVIGFESRRYQQKDPGFMQLISWYPRVVGTIPMEFGRLVCQRANCRWDAALRRRYATWTAVILGLVTVILIAVSLIGGLTVDKLLANTLAPLLPALLLATRQIKEHLEAAGSVDKLKEHADNLWVAALQGQLDSVMLEEQARRLQDEIYDHRRKAPLIFDWIYHLLKRQHEEQMNTAAEIMVEQWKAISP